MTAEVRTYAPDKVLVIVGGVPVTGYADGTFVNIEPMSDRVTSQAGADGEIARAVSADKRHTVTITLQQTSPANDTLSGFAAADSISGGGIMFPVLIQDLLGRSMFAAAQAWVAKAPARGYGKDISNREWVLHTGEPSVNSYGGNT